MKSKTLTYIAVIKPHLAACLVVIAMLSLAATPAGAVEPQKAAFTTSFSFPIQCSYGSLEDSLTFTGFGIFFFDSAGNLTRVNSHETIDATITNPANGKTATGSNTQNETNTFEPGQFFPTTDVVRGLTMAVTVPGVGQFRLAGRIIYDFSNGFAITFQTPHALPDESFTSALCVALQ